MKSKIVLLDANVIIEAFKFGLWESLISQFNIHVPSIIMRSEVKFFRNHKNEKIPINLVEDYLNTGKITEISATVDQLSDLSGLATESLKDSVDDGEFEAFAILNAKEYEDIKFCTGDIRAIKGLAALQLGGYGVSFEELITQMGRKFNLPLPSFSKVAFSRAVANGLMRRHLLVRTKRKNAEA